MKSLAQIATLAAIAFVTISISLPPPL